MPNKSTDQSKSRYTQGGLTDIFRSRLGWWERRFFVKANDDVTFHVHKRYEGRADIIAFAALGDEKLDWLVLQYNNIVDPAEELKVGSVLKLPTRARVTQLLNQPVGGVKK